MCCMICVEYAKGFMSPMDGIKALREFGDIDETHREEVQAKLFDDLIEEIYDNTPELQEVMEELEAKGD